MTRSAVSKRSARSCLKREEKQKKTYRSVTACIAWSFLHRFCSVHANLLRNVSADIRIPELQR